MEAIDVLQNSGVVLMPTDTIFGLSCLAYDRRAIEKLNRLKQRPQNKNYILLVENEAHLQRLVDVPDLAWDIIGLSEKPVTIIYDTILELPSHLLSENQTIAIRLVKSPLFQKLINRVKQPLISTSANLSGETPPVTLAEVSPTLLEQVDYVLPECKNFSPQHTSSSIIQLNKDGRVKIIRE